MIDRVTIQQVADVLGVTKRSAERRAKAWPYEEETTIGGRRRYYRLADLPATIQDAVCKSLSDIEPASPVSYTDYDDSTPFSYDRESLWSVYEKKPDSIKAKAQSRLAAINTALTLIQNGTDRTEAFNHAARVSGLNRSTLYRWYQDAKRYDRCDWLAALAPKHVGRVITATCSDDAWQFFKADYLREEQPTYSDCYDRLNRAAKEYGWQVPSVKTLTRRMERKVPLTVRVLKREGEYALMRLYPAQQRSVAELHALEWINADGYMHNVFVKWPDGTIARPKTWFFQDIYSRKILSWRTDQTENTDVIRLSFGELVERYGVPDQVTIDNTRGAANKWMTGGTPNRYRFKVKEDDPMGLFPVLGVKVHWTSLVAGKGHGQAKPVERAFGVGGIGEYIDKTPAFAGAYTGANPTAKPDNYGSKAVPLETFIQVLEQEIHAWNARKGRRTEMAEGVRSFDEVFSESYAAATIRKATTEQRRMWLLSAEAVKVRPDGSVALDIGKVNGVGRNRYFSETLYDHVGEKVICRFDPEQLHSAVHVYTLDGRYIDEAPCIADVGFGDTVAAREHNRARKEMIKATKQVAKAEAKMDAIEIAARLPGTEEPTIPDAGAVQMMSQPRYTNRTPQQRELSADERALQQELINNPTPIKKLPESARQRYQRWEQLDHRISEGAAVSDEEQHWHSTYQTTAEFAAEHEVAIEFGLTTAKQA